MYIVVGSITTATRLARILERNIGFASVVHTPSAIKNGGCSYSVRMKNADADAVREIAENFGFRIKGIYIEEKSGGEREYRDIS